MSNIWHIVDTVRRTNADTAMELLAQTEKDSPVGTALERAAIHATLAQAASLRLIAEAINSQEVTSMNGVARELSDIADALRGRR